MATSAELIKEESNELLLSRVNDIVFVDALAGFECRRCERTLIRHYVAHCGHYFCANCKRVLTLSKSNCSRPDCKQPLGDIDLQNVEFERKLYDLRAHCPNKKYGCKFVSQLKDIGGHLRVCKDTRERALPVEIPGPSVLEVVLRELSLKFDKLSDDVNQIREETSKIDKGLKVIKTKVDNNKEDMETKMAEMIKKFDGKSSETVNSLKDIKVEMERKIKNIETKIGNFNNNNLVEIKAEVDEKLTEMRKQWDDKANKTEVESFRVDLKKITQQVEVIKQEVIEQSERYTNGKITTIEKTIEDNQQKVFQLESFIRLRNPQMNAFALAENKCNFHPDFIWKISGIKEKLKQTTFEIKSEAFEWTGYPVQTEAKFKVNKDGDVWVSLCLKEINQGKVFDLKLIPHVYYVLRDQSGNGNTKHRSRSCTYLFASTFKNTLTFEDNLTQKSWLTNKLYIMDDSIVIEVYIEPPSLAQMVHSYNGTLVWAIDNYWKSKELEGKYLMGPHEDPYIYTAPKGYRVQVSMWLYGCGEYRGKGLTAQITFLTGEFDADLSRSFPHTTTITLFNRKDPRRNITKIVDQDIQTEKYYLIDVCSHEDIEHLIENDTVFFKVAIKPIN